MASSTVIKPRMTERGNKDKKLLQSYLFPEVRMKFKSKCSMNNIYITNLIEGFVEYFLKADANETKELIARYYKEPTRLKK